MPITRHTADFNWENVPVLAYKEEGTHFKAITRQVLYKGISGLPVELRYFEIAPGGYSTLEQHEHVHLVVIQHGHGAALVGTTIFHLSPFDVVEIPPRTWHQFHAAADQPLGFLCLVPAERDRPRRPDAEEIALLMNDPAVAGFIRI